MALAALVVAIISAIFTGVSLWVSHHAGRAAEASASEAKRSADAAVELTEIERERRAEEEAEAARKQEEAERLQRSARLTVRTERTVRAELDQVTLYDYRIVIGNEGPMDAHDVTLELLSVAGEGVVPAMRGERMPIGRLLPGREVSWGLVEDELAGYNRDIAESRLSWTDGRGQHNERRTVIRGHWA